MCLLLPKEVPEASRQAGVCPVTGDGSLDSRCLAIKASTMDLMVEREPPMAVKSHNMACKVPRFMGSTFKSVCLPAAQVRTDLQ